MGLYVITGGAGFIGSHLVDALLASGARVRVVDDLSTGRRENLDPRAELMLGDVADPQVMRRALQGASGCFHLAAIASVERSNIDWLGTHRCNLGGTVAVLEAARDAGRVPVVYASSAAVYGDHGDIRLHEALPLQPLSAYGADKMGSELHARAGYHVHGLPSLGLRFFNVYGPRQDPLSPYSGVISVFAGQIGCGRQIIINGDGRQTRDFIYVADVVEHLLAGMERCSARAQAAVFNACTGVATSVMTLAQTLGSVIGTTPRIGFAPPRAGDVHASLGSPSAARLALRVAMPTPLAQGLTRLLGAAPNSGMRTVVQA
jgi:UDP-glucose 4-epimerase